MSSEEMSGMATTAVPSRKRARAATPAASAPQPPSQAEILQAVLLEMRAMWEEQTQREAIHAAELLRRDEELLQLRREIQLSPLINRASGDDGNVGATFGLSGTRNSCEDPSTRSACPGASGARIDSGESAARTELGYKLKPDVYDGSVPLREFFSQFEIIARANQWSNESKTIALASCLRGKARSILDTVENIDNLEYAELKSKLELRFGEGHLFQNYYSIFTNRKQKFGEDFASLGSELERLVRLAYPECPFAVRDKIACAQFISALMDGCVRRTLQLEGVTSLKLAIERARAVKMIFGENSGGSGKRKENFVKGEKKLVLQDGNEKDKEKGDENSGRDSSRGNRYRASAKECWLCGKIGHFRAECPANMEKGNAE